MKRRSRSRGFGPKNVPHTPSRPPDQPQEGTYDGYRKIGASDWEYEGFVPDDADFDAIHASDLLKSAPSEFQRFMVAAFYMGAAWGIHKTGGVVRSPKTAVYLLVELERVSRRGREIGVWRKRGTKILCESYSRKECCAAVPNREAEFGVLKVVGTGKRLLAVYDPNDREWYAPDLPYLG